MSTDDRRMLRAQLALAGATLKDLAVESNVRYDRLVKIIGGFRDPRPAEMDAIDAALGRLTARRGR